MKKPILAFLVVLFSVVALLTTSTTVLAAQATKEPFTGTMTFTGMTPPERLWTDEEGVQHVRGLGETFSISGSIVGTVAFTVNWNFVVSGYSQSGDAQAKGIITSGEDVYLMCVTLPCALISCLTSNVNVVTFSVGILQFMSPCQRSFS